MDLLWRFYMKATIGARTNACYSPTKHHCLFASCEKQYCCAMRRALAKLATLPAMVMSELTVHFLLLQKQRKWHNIPHVIKSENPSLSPSVNLHFTLTQVLIRIYIRFVHFCLLVKLLCGFFICMTYKITSDLTSDLRLPVKRQIASLFL